MPDIHAIDAVLKEQAESYWRNLRADYLVTLRRYGAPACSTFRRPPDWSPARDVAVCACGATIGQHAAKELADRIAREAGR